jgi:hypothetical protein
MGKVRAVGTSDQNKWKKGGSSGIPLNKAQTDTPIWYIKWFTSAESKKNGGKRQIREKNGRYVVREDKILTGP